MKPQLEQEHVVVDIVVVVIVVVVAAVVTADLKMLLP
jgi:hypothetical protein